MGSVGDISQQTALLRQALIIPSGSCSSIPLLPPSFLPLGETPNLPGERPLDGKVWSSMDVPPAALSVAAECRSALPDSLAPPPAPPAPYIQVRQRPSPGLPPFTPESTYLQHPLCALKVLHDLHDLPLPPSPPPPLLARLPFLSDRLCLTYAPAAPAPRTRGLPCGCHLSPCPGALTALHSGWEEGGLSGVSNHALQPQAKDRSMPEAPAGVKAKQLAALSRELLAGSCRSGLNITGGRR